MENGQREIRQREKQTKGKMYIGKNRQKVKQTKGKTDRGKNGQREKGKN